MTVTNERNTLNQDAIKYTSSFDGMGLPNSYAIAPAIHEETDKDQAETEGICTVIAIFSSRHEGLFWV